MTIHIVSQIGQCTIYRNIQSIGVCGEILCLYDYKGHSVFEAIYGSFKYTVVHIDDSTSRCCVCREDCQSST